MGVILSKRKLSQKSCAELAVIAKTIMQEILDVSKGRLPMESGAWFYRLFPSRSFNEYAIPEDPVIIHEKLASAWWVEEEDLRQYLLMFIWRKKIYGGRGPGLRYILAYEAVRYLIRQGVFKRQTDWEEDYSIYFSQPEDQSEWEPGAEILFDGSLDTVLPDKYEQYLFYLNKVVGYGFGRLEDILLLSPRTIKLALTDLNKKMEEVKCQQ